MIAALLIFAQAAAEAPPPPVAPGQEVEILYKLAPAKRPARSADDAIVVTARPGEHPARLGQVLPPNAAGPLLPKASIDLGNGVTAASDVRTHPREGGAEMYLTLTVPF